MEQIIRDILIGKYEEKKILYKNQHGFRSSMSCLTNLLTALNDWTNMQDKNHPFDILYFDFEKAFDTVPHRRLLYKLHQTGVEGNILGWIEDFLPNRVQCEDKRSIIHPV